MRILLPLSLLAVLVSAPVLADDEVPIEAAAPTIDAVSVSEDTATATAPESDAVAQSQAQAETAATPAEDSVPAETVSESQE